MVMLPVTLRYIHKRNNLLPEPMTSLSNMLFASFHLSLGNFLSKQLYFFISAIIYRLMFEYVKHSVHQYPTSMVGEYVIP